MEETFWPPHLSFLVWLRVACISKRLVWHHKTTDSPSPISQIWWPPPPVRVWRHLSGRPQLAIPLAHPNSISTKILPGLTLASTKTRNKHHRPTTTIMICKCYRVQSQQELCNVLRASRQGSHKCTSKNPQNSTKQSLKSLNLWWCSIKSECEW